MPWTYESFENPSNAINVINEINNFLNGLSSAQGVTAKVGLTDQHEGAAFGVVFYDNNMTSVPPAAVSTDWQHQSEVFGSNSQYGENYDKFVDLLNSLNPTQAAYAHFCMSDYNTGKCHMAMYWQNLSEN